MNRRTHHSLVSAFTLVELLVVIAIITLLIGIALPAFNHAKKAAKRTATKAVISSIEGGLAAYREERALGNTYPPSASDSARDSDGYCVIKDPITTSGEDVRITGASLLVYGLAGADLQGTRGFKRVGTVPTWAASMTPEADIDAQGTDGLHCPTANPPWPKYSLFGGANLIERATSIESLEKFPWNKLDNGPLSDHERIQLVFRDDFGGPILYYKSRGAARNMITNPDETIGIYDFRDNALLTKYPDSLLRTTRYDEPPPPFAGGFGDEGAFDGFILDSKASRRSGPQPTDPLNVARPVRPDDFLLISAGPDQFFGTKDDVVNWNQ